MKRERPIIVFILPSLAAGGAERVVSFVAANIEKEEFDSRLVVVGSKEQTAFEITGIPITYLNKSRVLYSVWPIFKLLRKMKPDIVLSAIGHLNTVTAYLSVLFPKIKFVAREVNILSILKSYQLKKGGISKNFSERRFKFFDKVICQSNDMLKDLQAEYKIKPEKMVVINNPITDAFQLDDRLFDSSLPLSFITVARLKAQKGHERILRALAEVNFSFNYTIIGDGPELENVNKLIEELNLADKIEHVPFTKDVHEYLGRADLYLQGSFIEGFPNSLVESCAVGTPVLAFDAPGGLNEIIEEGVNGFIVDDHDTFVSKLVAINRLYPFDRVAVSDSVFKKYHKDIILKKYEETLNSLINRHE